MISKTFNICFFLFFLLIEAGGQDTYNFSTAIEYLKHHNGHALLIYKNNHLISETYMNGWNADKPHRLASGTKSFSAILALIAESENLLHLDEKICDTIMEWENDPRKNTLTIRELLSLRSGIDGGEIGQVPTYEQAILKAEIRHEKGQFSYGPIPFQIFGELMTRKLSSKDQSVEHYLNEKLLSPINLKPDFWKKNSHQPNLPSGAYLKAREWAKFGLLLLNKGQYHSKSIVPPKQLQKLSVGSEKKPHYGLCFWYSPDLKVAKDIYLAAGAGKQMLAIVPSKDLVVVQFAEAKKGFQKETLMELVLKEL